MYKNIFCLLITLFISTNSYADDFIGFDGQLINKSDVPSHELAIAVEFICWKVKFTKSQNELNGKKIVYTEIREDGSFTLPDMDFSCDSWSFFNYKNFSIYVGLKEAPFNEFSQLLILTRLNDDHLEQAAEKAQRFEVINHPNRYGVLAEKAQRFEVINHPNRYGVLAGPDRYYE